SARHGDAGATKFARVAVDLPLCLQREAGDEVRMARDERENPAALGASARHGHDHLHERREIELVAAKAARLNGAVKTGAQEVLMSLLRHAPGGFALSLAFAQDFAK